VCGSDILLPFSILILTKMVYLKGLINKLWYSWIITCLKDFLPHYRSWGNVMKLILLILFVYFYFLQVEAAKGFLGVLRSYLDSLCSNLRSHTITNVQSNNDKVCVCLLLWLLLFCDCTFWLFDAKHLGFCPLAW